MSKLVIVLSVLAVFLIAESACQLIIRPTYRPPPPPRRPVIMRARRDAGDEPLWLYQGDVPKAPSSADHPVLPSIIDDVRMDPNRRTARSLSTPSHVSHGGGSRRSSSRDTGPTHPGYNRRNARSLHLPDYKFPLPTLPPFNPRPRYPWDDNPRYPIYV
ncbi:lebocin-4-like [Spodoptera litura]|uniref:Lebocin 1 n=1 Tax=Spodoptera litura TaxID=69820 RepID=A0A1B1Y1Y8_SPOLT|nr:lebocin-4-like [Spodoptera litura]ANW86206.1 lebocin 1 [Spodoptera litura]